MNFIGLFFLLLVLFQVKHFLADYPLQGKYMLGKFKGGSDWVAPLLAHVGVHGLLTLIIALLFLQAEDYGWAVLIAAFDMCLHFSMDRIKASPDLMGRWKPLNAAEYVGLQQTLKVWEDLPERDRDYSAKPAVNEAKRRIGGNTYFWWALATAAVESRPPRGSG